MSAAAIRPRFDQIDALTKGLQLPLPAVSVLHLEIIAEGLARAFSDISSQWPAAVASGTEAEVTTLMEASLIRMIDEDPLWGLLVSNVARGKESVSYDGSHLENRPDLSISLSDRNRRFPLIAEAKIIDAAASKSEKLYCDHGINRFVIGDYAWGNREAFMIAYVRDGSSISSKLRPFLSKAMSHSPPTYLITGLPVSIGSGVVDLATSRHDRNFAYAPLLLTKPGPISIWHLWLS